MKKHRQLGTIYEASNSYFVRYFAIVDGVKQRVSHKLCDRDEEHYSTTCDAVLDLRDEHMVTVRRPNPIAAHQALCHLDLSTTMRHYIKTKRTALAEGIQMLDERLALSK